MEINIPKPCHENWEAMTSEVQGKFCKVCSEKVHDFTAFSDAELMNSLTEDKNICGRFREDQLGRNLNFSVISAMALGLLGGSGVLSSTSAQEIKNEKVKTADPTKGLPVHHPANNPAYKNVTVMLGKPLAGPTDKPIIILDKKRITEADLRNLSPDKVKSMNILSGEGAVKLYGKKGENGVIVITSK